MRLPPARVGHPEVETIQATFHALKRFRERHFRDEPGADAAIEALVRVLEGAEITARPPGGLSGSWDLWAVSGRLVFPLERDAGGTWIATTCLTAGR